MGTLPAHNLANFFLKLLLTRVILIVGKAFWAVSKKSHPFNLPPTFLMRAIYPRSLWEIPGDPVVFPLDGGTLEQERLPLQGEIPL